MDTSPEIYTKYFPFVEFVKHHKYLLFHSDNSLCHIEVWRLSWPQWNWSSFLNSIQTVCKTSKQICLDVCLEMIFLPSTFTFSQRLFWLIDFLGKTLYDTWTLFGGSQFLYVPVWLLFVIKKILKQLHKNGQKKKKKKEAMQNVLSVFLENTSMPKREKVTTLVMLSGWHCENEMNRDIGTKIVSLILRKSRNQHLRNVEY